jgi:hypothetical protein
VTGYDWEFIGQFLYLFDGLLDSLPNISEWTGVFSKIVGY